MFAGSAAALAQPVGWDLRFGPALVGVTHELEDSLSHNGIGSDLGASVRWPGAATLSVQGELLLTRRRRSFDDPITFGVGAGTTVRRTFEVLYAEVPLLARASLGTKGKVRPFAVAGPYVAWRLHVGESFEPADVRAVDLGTILGIGTEFVSEKSTVALEARLGLGAVDVLADHTGVQGAYHVWTFFVAFTP
jgi:hypothetical protein